MLQFKVDTCEREELFDGGKKRERAKSKARFSRFATILSSSKVHYRREKEAVDLYGSRREGKELTLD